MSFNIGSFFGGIGQSIASAATTASNDLVSGVGAVSKPVAQALTVAGTGAYSDMAHAVNDVRSGAIATGNYIGNAENVINKQALNGATAIGDEFAHIGGQSLGAVQTGVSDVVNGTKTLGSDITGTLGNAGKSISNFFGGIGSWLANGLKSLELPLIIIAVIIIIVLILVVAI